MDNENLMFGDAAYDSNVLRTIAKNIKFGKIITLHNPRNSKKRKKQGVSFMNKLMSKDHIKIEHYFAKLKK